MDCYLKRCPFCGSMAILDEVKSVKWRGGKSRTITKYIAQCIIPRCVGHHGKAYGDKNSAIDKWNLRVGYEPEMMVGELRKILTDAGVVAK